MSGGIIMSTYKHDIIRLTTEFKQCQKILCALGDANRQHLIIEMMKIDDCYGVHVGTIAKKTNLSRSSVFHHIRILKEAGIIKMRREGTKNYYYFDADMQSLDDLITMLEHVKSIMKLLPDRTLEK